MTRTLGMFPLSTVLFPQAVLPLHVFEPRYRALMSDCRSADGAFGVVLISRGSEVGGGDERVDIGTVARIAQASMLDDGRLVVMAVGSHRVRIRQWLDDDPYPQALVESFPLDPGPDPGQPVAVAEAAVRRLRSLLSELGEVPALRHDLDLGGPNEQVAWQLCDLAPVNLMDRQKLLSSECVTDQMVLLAELCDASSEDVLRMLAEGHRG